MEQVVSERGSSLHFLPCTADFSSYRGRFQKTNLSRSGEIPFGSDPISPEEHNATLSSVTSLWELISTANGSAQRRSRDLTIPTAAESWLGFKRWILSHHLFIPTLALIGHCLTETVRSTQLGQPLCAIEWAQLAARMRKGCGALCVYGIDFEPCSEIYCTQIRSQMPAGFTGYEIRERQHVLQPAIALFLQSFPASPEQEFSKHVRTFWLEADYRYHELHQSCMLMAVPPPPGRGVPQSLRQQYLKENGEAHKITEEEFSEYDRWFGLERSNHLTRLDYVFQISEVMERILADVMVGHRLQDSVFRELLDGMRAVLVVFSTWAGKITETSPFYHRYLRGE